MKPVSIHQNRRVSSPTVRRQVYTFLVGAALCCEEASTRHEFLWSVPASSQHKAAPTGGVQALNLAQY
ncbi:hypothetical protein CR511_14290 [Pseudomonas putida]|nr:hypothetical protein CR511_14290 [Pseudomonas putida]